MRVTLSLRPATEADAPLLLRVYRSTRDAEMAPWPWTDAQKDEFCATQFAAQDRSYRSTFPKGEFLVISCGDEAVGRLYRATDERMLHLLDISLLPRWRNLGLGTRLLRQTMALAEANDRIMQLHVEKANPARRLCLRLGFREVEDLGIHLRLQWRALPMPTSIG
jgi:ribosomal protein S18 acetylase RimI-like enzyme